jgi:hypothetical protein
VEKYSLFIGNGERNEVVPLKFFARIFNIPVHRAYIIYSAQNQ